MKVNTPFLIFKEWDGTKSGGNALPAGIYLVQLNMEGEVVNKRIVLQRL